MNSDERAEKVLQAFYRFQNSKRSVKDKDKPHGAVGAIIDQLIKEAVTDAGASVADQVQHAVEAEREACAKLVENFDAIDDENGGFLTPGLGSWRKDGEEESYQPDEDLLAAAIRGRT